MDNKPVQIAIAPATEFGPSGFVVIREDGTIWILNGGYWTKLPDLPSEVADDTED